MTRPEPTVWSVTYPPEPGPEVTTVRDGEGDLWHRLKAFPHMWHCPAMPKTPSLSWTDLFEYEPLTDATHEPTAEETSA